jgi:type IV pilus assembly protein PilE
MAAPMEENAMTNGSRRRTLAGFTLLEVMITVVIVGILASIALPSYNYFVTRSRITEATNTLSSMRTQMEKWFMDHRTYIDTVSGKCGIEAAAPNLINTYNADANNKFTMSCVPAGLTASTYTLRATGNGPMLNFIYEINEQNAKNTVQAGTWPLPSPNNCWALRKDGSCS